MSNVFEDAEDGPPSHWGVVAHADGKPVPFVPPPMDAKLHVSQVCMGPGTKEGARAYLRCKVQEGPALVIAALREGTCENVSVDLVYDEYTEFSVEGDAPLHISGYMMYMADKEDEGPGGYLGGPEGEEEESSDDEPYTPEEVAALRKMLQGGGGEDDSDEEEDSDFEDEAPTLIPMDAEGVDEDTDDDDSEDEDDSDECETDEDEDADVVAAAAQRKSTVVIEEIPAEAADPVQAATQKRKAHAAAMEKPQSAKKQKQQAQQQQDQAAAEAALAAGSQPPDASSQPKTKAEKAAAKAVHKAAAAQQAGVKSSQGETPSRSDVPQAQTPQSKKSKAKAAADQPAATLSASHSAGKQPKSSSQQQTPASAAADTLLNGSAGKNGKKGVRAFPNGLKIENVAMGQPDGKLAKAGKRVKMKYVGRLASNGKIFDQTRGNKTFSFRLGVGEVISGWDKGVDGMRVGDKRKLTIPPSMGYGASGAPPDIPGNATLVFDVELVNVM